MKKRRDYFNISEGNLLVLTLIPKMMKYNKYRKALRQLAIDFYTSRSNSK